MPIVLGRGSTGGGGSGGAPTGPAGGALAGTYPNPTLAPDLTYTEFTSNVTISATSAATATTVVTAAAVVFDGSTRVCVEFYTPSVLVGAGAGAFVVVTLWDGSTDVARVATIADPSAQIPVSTRRYLTPSAASHTYSIRAFRNIADGTVVGGTGTGGGANQMPGYIRITAVGAAS